MALPFVLLLFGIMSVCLYYFADFSTENATWQAARAIRTGQLQQGQGAYAGAVTDRRPQEDLQEGLLRQGPPVPRLYHQGRGHRAEQLRLRQHRAAQLCEQRRHDQRRHGGIQPRRGQLRDPRHRLLPLGVRRQAADVQPRQPARTAPSSCRPRPPSAPSPTTDGLRARRDSTLIEFADQTGPPCRPLSLSDLGARAGALLGRWRADASGMAAVEFAFIVPIMGVMFIGAVELSQAIIVDRRVTQIASSTADLVARVTRPRSRRPTSPTS